jgi:hypothetical protein
MTNELKDILRGAMFKELEAYFLAEADKLQHKTPDRTKSYEEQGKESHVNELAADAVRNVIRSIGQEVNPQTNKKISYK